MNEGYVISLDNLWWGQHVFNSVSLVDLDQGVHQGHSRFAILLYLARVQAP